MTAFKSADCNRSDGSRRGPTVVLAGGTGRRMLAYTQGRNKHFIEVNGEALLTHVLRPILITPSSRPVIVVTTPETHPEVEHLLNELGCSEPDATVRAQRHPTGTLDAVCLAVTDTAASWFTVCLGENLFAWPQLPPPPDTLLRGEIAAVLYARRGADPEGSFGHLVTERRGQQLQCRGIVEKPRVAVTEDDLLITGLFRFSTPALWEFAANVQMSSRGEYELTGLLHQMASLGAPVEVHVIDCEWTDCGTPGGLGSASAVLAARARFAGAGQ